MYNKSTYSYDAGVKLSQDMLNKEPQAVNSYIEWSELNALYGRVMTLLEAIGAMPEETVMDTYRETSTGGSFSGLISSRRAAIKSLLSQAIFSQDYKGFGVTETELETIKGFQFFPTK